MKQIGYSGIDDTPFFNRHEEAVYQEVVKALPTWKPTRCERSFGISAIQKLTNARFLVARKVLKRLRAEGHLDKLEDLV